MASVFASFTTSASTAFDTVTTTIQMVGQTVNIASRALTALDAKTQAMTTSVTRDIADRDLVEDDLAMRELAREATDRMEAVHLKTAPAGTAFDRSAYYQHILSKLEARRTQAAA